MKADATKASASVRRATGADAASIHTLSCELAEVVGDTYPSPESIRKRLDELLDEPRTETLVVEMEGEVVGVVSFWIKPDLAHGDITAEIPMLAVLKTHRRTGAGRALMDETRRIASERGAVLIELITTPANVTARSFYRSLGFVETDHLVLELVGDPE